jgi:pimeloyl-ACP methyl ester carboxylesterase
MTQEVLVQRRNLRELSIPVSYLQAPCHYMAGLMLSWDLGGMFLPSFVPISASGSSPSQWMIVMHGIYGRGANWRSFARKLCEQNPEWGCLLTDLRMHGRSMSAPPPHDLSACAHDLLALIDQQEAAGKKVAAVLGHSFGGKVALEMRRIRPSLPAIWLIDSSPSAHPNAMNETGKSVVAVLALLETLPSHFESRDDFVSRVLHAGFEKNLALWLAMNLEMEGERYRLTLRAAAMKDLLSDYYARDLWSVMEADGEAIHVVCASRGSAWSEDDLSRLRKLPTNLPVRQHRLDGGHWLHVDALEPLVALVASHL